MDWARVRRASQWLLTAVRKGPLVSAVAGAVAVVFVWAPASQAQEAAVAAQGPPVNVSVFLSSRTDVCHEPGIVAAVKKFATLEKERINRQGGVAGRPLELRFLDDNSDPKQAIANVKSALADPLGLAMIGLSNSNRAKAVFDAVGPDIGRSGIPFVSDITVTSVFEKYTNVYTTRSAQDSEQIPVIARFIQDLGFARPAFIGLSGMVFSEALGNGLKASMGTSALIADRRLALDKEALLPAEVAAAIAELKVKNPDLLILGIGSNRTGAVLKQMMAAGVVPPLFISGRISSLPPEVVAAYPNDLYQLAWDDLPEIDNDRLRRIISRDEPDDWLFEGRKIAAAPGWSKGECKERTAKSLADPLNPDNMRAIAAGTQYADMVALVASATSRASQRGSALAELRTNLLQELRTTYATGRGIFKGAYENWSFYPSSRSAARTPFIVMRPHALGRNQLAPVQYTRLKSGSLRNADTMYLDIDLIRAHSIDDNAKTFFAEFYLSMRNRQGTGADQIDFTNAALDPKTNGRQITFTMLHDGGKSDAYPEGMKIYKVAGTFLFQPDLTIYPFDTQRFTIDLQPRRGDAPFVVQPPPLVLRDKQVATDGWDSQEQYVGHDEDFVPVIDPYTHEASVVPFYKTTFVWIMKRQTTDYLLRVVVPLAFILIVAYLSIFIPESHFEAIVTIQVTALLSAVALYLSLPKLDSDTATLSDRIFVFDYLAVSLMIVISILRVNRRVASRPQLKSALGAIHVVVIPIMVAMLGYYLYLLKTANS